MRLNLSRRADDPRPEPAPRRPLRPRSHRRGSAAWLPTHLVPALVAVLALSAVVVAVAVNAGRDSPDQARGQDPATSESGRLGAWLRVNVRAGTRVLVPGPLVAAVRRADPHAVVVPYDGAAPGAPDLIVMTRAAAVPAGLRAVAARTFTVARVTGPAGIEVRQVVSRPDSLPQARRRTATAGGQLAQNPALHVPDDDAAALRAGDVDPRLLVTLAALAAGHDLDVDLVPDAAAPAGTIRYREARIVAVDGVRLASHPSAAAPLARFLRAQPAPYQPAESRVLAAGAGRAFALRYAVPIPLGVLEGQEIPTVGP